ncbi:hypothetical protein U3516DRAFT_902179, partial [Neocallimastix sp. 'constans']
MKGNSSNSFGVVDEIHRSTESWNGMTVQELEELDQQIRDNISSTEEGSRINELLLGALNVVEEIITRKNEEIKFNSSLKALNEMRNNNRIICNSGREAVDYVIVDYVIGVALDYVGTCEVNMRLDEDNKICMRMESADGKRVVRYYVDQSDSEYKGMSHFSFEIIDEEYLSDLNKELDFEVKSNYHIFIGNSSSKQQEDDEV